jgi:Ca2+-binding RTX toxin-like protein
MATLTVTTRADRVDAGDGVLSLREALAAADRTPHTADRIEFDTAAMGGSRIVLAGRALVTRSEVTIDGGDGVTLDAAHRSRVLETGADLALERVTVTGGRDSGDNALGGGIFAGGALRLTECTLTGNEALGTYSGGGGAIWGGEIDLVRCTVSDNYAEGREGSGDRYYSCVGGGIRGGSVHLVDSTVYGNTVYAADYVLGGGILADELYVTGSTVTGNRSVAPYFAGGGGLATDGGYSEVANSIVSGNEGGWDSVFLPSDVEYVAVSNGHNIFGSDVTADVPGDLENTAPGLLFAGGLADHGGPTWTVALRDATDNPALGGADPADASATDQRGIERPLPAGSAPDIGAFELGQTGAPASLVFGTNHADRLFGTDGRDLMRGFAGDDVLRGLAGDDRLFGGSGDDILFGKAGLDRLQGDAGADRFALRLVSDTPTGGPGYEEILDFSRPDHDRIDVSALDAKAGVTGNQAFTFIGQAEFSAAGQLHYQATADGDFLVSGNVDRDLDADFAIVVRTGSTGLLAGDFLL